MKESKKERVGGVRVRGSGEVQAKIKGEKGEDREQDGVCAHSSLRFLYPRAGDHSNLRPHFTGVCPQHPHPHRYQMVAGHL